MCDWQPVENITKDLMMYSALVEPAMEGGEPCIRILLITYAVYGLSRYCIRNTSDLAHPLLDFPSDYLGTGGFFLTSFFLTYIFLTDIFLTDIFIT